MHRHHELCLWEMLMIDSKEDDLTTFNFTILFRLVEINIYFTTKSKSMENIFKRIGAVSKIPKRCFFVERPHG